MRTEKVPARRRQRPSKTRIRKVTVYDTTLMRVYPAPAGFPTSVRIRGRDYSVVYCAPIVDADHQYHGLCKHDERTILVDPTEPVHQIRETLLHEIMHVYAHESNMPNGELLEKICDSFASAFCDLVDNNPKI